MTYRADFDSELQDEILGSRNALICTVALLVGLLEEKGVVESGMFRSVLKQALSQIDDERSSPEAQTLAHFISVLGDPQSLHCESTDRRC